MSGAAANQHIEIEGSVLSKQVSTLKDASTTFSSTASAVSGTLSGDAFGAISRGILVPAVTALAGRSRELLDSATTLRRRCRHSMPSRPRRSTSSPGTGRERGHRGLRRDPRRELGVGASHVRTRG
jgi:hypothetical protein